MTDQARSRLVMVLLAPPATGHMLGYVFPTMEHVLDPAWPDHARFHVFQGLLLLVGMDLLALLVTFGPFRQGAPWSRWVLVGYFLFGQLSYFVAMAVVPTGLPPGLALHLLYVFASLMFVSGLVLGWRRVGDSPYQLA